MKIIKNFFGPTENTNFSYPPQRPIELTDAEFEIIKKVMDLQLTMVSWERLFATALACKYVVKQEIAGDFVECGVWRGGNSIVAASIFNLNKSPRKVWLYDTFLGMTKPTEVDFQNSDGLSAEFEFNVNQKGTHNDWCFSSIEEVQRNIKLFDLSLEGFEFIIGDVLKTLEVSISNIPTEISVLRLDTDWYESTKIELETLYPRLSIGGALIIDDYGHWAGSKKATDEFFSETKSPFFSYTDYTGRCAIKIQN